MVSRKDASAKRIRSLLPIIDEERSDIISLEFSDGRSSNRRSPFTHEAITLSFSRPTFMPSHFSSNDSKDRGNLSMRWNSSLPDRLRNESVFSKQANNQSQNTRWTSECYSKKPFPCLSAKPRLESILQDKNSDNYAGLKKPERKKSIQEDDLEDFDDDDYNF